MSDDQIMAIYFDRQERAKARRAVFKKNLGKKIDNLRTNSGEAVGNCGDCGNAVASCDGSTDDYTPEQLSFFD